MTARESSLEGGGGEARSPLHEPKTYSASWPFRRCDRHQDDAGGMAAAEHLRRVVRAIDVEMRAERLTQDGLAELAGVTQATVSRVLRGEHWPRTEVLFKLTTVLDIDLRAVAPSEADS
jgi:DNA-binding XRE family transcriptional regulator